MHNSLEVFLLGKGRCAALYLFLLLVEMCCDGWAPACILDHGVTSGMKVVHVEHSGGRSILGLLLGATHVTWGWRIADLTTGGSVPC